MKRLVGIILVKLLISWAVLMAGPVLPSTHYKHRVTETVCRRIAAAYGDPLIRPRLEVVRKSGRGRVARFDVEAGNVLTLRIDEQVYDLCRRYGSDSLSALACIVGHELAHFYQQRGFLPAYSLSAGLVNKPTENSAANRKQIEAEADRFGLYYGYMAGFDTYRLLPQVLDAVYRTYGLPDHLAGYPSRTERAAISVQEQRRFKPLALAFEAGQLLWLTQHYEEATVCFQHLLNQFHSKEIYNNLGVIRLTQAVREMPVRAVPYAYPFEWDAGNRLRMGNLRGDSPDQKRSTAYLQQAKEYFKAAQQIDPTYETAAINLACTYSLLANQAGSLSTIQELEEACRERNVAIPANAHLIKGITYARNGQPDQAAPLFAEAVRQKAFRAAYNRDVFQKIQAENQGVSLAPNWSAIERWIRQVWAGPSSEPTITLREGGVGSLRFSSWLHKSALRDTLFLPHTTNPINIIQQAATDGTALRLLTTDQRLEILSTTSLYKGVTRAGLRIGQTVSELHRRYGTSDAVLRSAGDRQFWHYKSLAMLVEVRSGHVSGWHLYQY